MKRALLFTLVLVVILVSLLVIIFTLYFNRIPQRSIPDGTNLITAPANGEVIDIIYSDDEKVSFFKNDTENYLYTHDIDPPYQIVIIELGLDDIHAQRAPIMGRVVATEHFPGGHKNALGWNRYNLVNLNEKFLTIFENNSVSVGVIQVAGKAARRIQTFAEEGDIFYRGDIFGRILFGSQVVMVIPDSVKLHTTIGDELIDGETIIGEYPL